MIPAREYIWRSFVGRRGNLLLYIGSNRFLNPCVNVIECRGIKNKNKKEDAPSCIASIARRLPVTSNSDYIDVGAELSSSLAKAELAKILNSFAQRKEIKSLALEHGLDESLWKQAFNSFRMYCVTTKTLPVDLHIVLSDVLQGAGNVTDIFPYFIRHAKNIFPHISCLDDLKKISDLRSPANWYPLARSATRRIIFHAGPTNSGKTHHALERFYNAKSGVYCGPLKLLVSEVFQKSNSRGTPCDLVTGDERKYAYSPDKPASHLSCSVEMISVKNNYEVAIIDEIQQMRDSTRGWAWTRALLGIPAEEIHLCGEAAAINLVTAICLTTGENVEVRKYKRLTELEVDRSALGGFDRVQPGDCIVCFNKHDIYSVSRSIEHMGKKVAVIYGSLPPATKLAQAAKFNDPNDPCKIMVATNAIGMGLNLHIRRIVFYSLIQPTINDKGEKEMNIISVSSALQIAGRAGRYGTSWEKGYVTTYKPEDLPTLKYLLNKTPEEIVQAGLHPTADQIELYAYYLPKTSLSSLMDLFVSLCKVDNSLYFMCNIDDFKFLADMIEHISLPLRARYVFCCAPINRKFPFVCSMFLKFAREYSKNSPVTFSWLCENIGWPFRTPETVIDLIHLESVFDVFDLYLWLSYRFMDLFPDGNTVRDLQNELDAIIEKAVYGVVKLLEKSETGLSSGYSSISDTDNFVLQTSKQNFYKGDNSLRKQRRQGKLTEKLLNQGLLTPQMLEELHQEWSAGKKK